MSEIVTRCSLVILVIIALFSIASTSWAQSALTLTIHYVQGTVNEDGTAYDVEVYLSAVDEEGYPVVNLTESSFTLLEDSQKVSIDSVDIVVDRPINLVLVLDTSGSMVGRPIQDARNAAADFVRGLGEQDQVAIKSFNQLITTVTDFTSDTAVASMLIQQIDAKQNTGTCLYDAAYEAVQTAATATAGRRAVVLLTDGKDQISVGTICSIHTIDDVINLASEGNTKIPIYTIGLGSKVDEQSLQRMSLTTGGSYRYSPDSTQLNDMFTRLSAQLKTEYIIRYTSTAGSGAHLLVATANYMGAEAQDSRNFLLPELPPSIAIVYPAEGQEVSGKVNIAASVRGQAELVEKVVFQINGQDIGFDVVVPYDFEFDFTDTQIGAQKITAIAYGQDSIELSRNTVLINVVAPTAPTEMATPEPTSEPVSEVGTTPTVEPTATPGPSDTRNTLIYILVGFALLLTAAIITVTVIYTLRKKAQKEREQAEWFDKPVTPTMPFIDVQEELTFDQVRPGVVSDVYGTLTVVYSDDESTIGQVMNLSNSPTTIGRSVDNDIFFPKDSPVSRKHATIERQGNQAILNEVITTTPDGKIKLPTYGTFVNEMRIEGNQRVLNNGDEVRLGNRLKFRFNRTLVADISEDVTFDGLAPPPDFI